MYKRKITKIWNKKINWCQHRVELHPKYNNVLAIKSIFNWFFIALLLLAFGEIQKSLFPFSIFLIYATSTFTAFSYTTVFIINFVPSRALPWTIWKSCAFSRKKSASVFTWNFSLVIIIVAMDLELVVYNILQKKLEVISRLWFIYWQKLETSLKYILHLQNGRFLDRTAHL